MIDIVETFKQNEYNALFELVKNYVTNVPDNIVEQLLENDNKIPIIGITKNEPLYMYNFIDKEYTKLSLEKYKRYLQYMFNGLVSKQEIANSFSLTIEKFNHDVVNYKPLNCYIYMKYYCIFLHIGSPKGQDLSKHNISFVKESYCIGGSSTKVILKKSEI